MLEAKIGLKMTMRGRKNHQSEKQQGTVDSGKLCKGVETVLMGHNIQLNWLFGVFNYGKKQTWGGVSFHSHLSRGLETLSPPPVPFRVLCKGKGIVKDLLILLL